jgi:hypothetical protein
MNTPGLSRLLTPWNARRRPDCGSTQVLCLFLDGYDALHVVQRSELRTARHERTGL